MKWNEVKQKWIDLLSAQIDPEADQNYKFRVLRFLSQANVDESAFLSGLKGMKRIMEKDTDLRYIYFQDVELLEEIEKDLNNAI